MINKQVTNKYYLEIVAGIIGQELGLHYTNNRLQELLCGLERTSELFQGKLSTVAIIEEILKAKSIPQHLYSPLSTSLTINETYFFRETPAIDLFKTVIISEIEKSGGNYKIWSAGCSSGEEPFTLAIIIKEMLPAHIAKNIKIIATDISSKALNKAKEGIYTEWSFRETPQYIKKKYFKAVDNRWLISKEIKEMVSFSHLNLISENFPSPSMGIDNLNLIFCRNVLMYFSYKNMRLVINKLHHSLREGGWLVTSQVELNNELFSSFAKRNICKGFFYRREELVTPEKKLSYQNRDISKEIIPQIKETLRKSVNSRSPRFVIDSEADKAAKKPLLEVAKELANRGDYDKALDILDELLNKDTLEVDFFYLYATILSERGDIEKAAEYYKKCIYLDPTHILANYMLANIYVELDKKEISMKYFRVALNEAKQKEPNQEISHSGGISAQRLVEILENIVEDK